MRSRVRFKEGNVNRQCFRGCCVGQGVAAGQSDIDYTLQRPFGSYRFVSVDAVIRPATVRHFFGELDDNDIVELGTVTLGRNCRRSPRRVLPCGYVRSLVHVFSR